jgi:hypothetical protein
METPDDVDTIIVNHRSVSIERMQLQYGCSQNPVNRKIHIERPNFIMTCISQNRFRHKLPKVQGLGGPRTTRQEFVHSHFADFSCLCLSLQPYLGRCPF